MSRSFQKFADLHRGDKLFVLPNAWDARSAVVFQECGFEAVGTSSAAVANSLGFDDGENMSFQDYLFVIKRILASVSIPLTIDLEMGYGNDNDEIAGNVCHLGELGVVGINLEDSTIIKGERKLKDAAVFGDTVKHVKSKLRSKGIELFVNVRCDTHILDVSNKQEETLSRIKLYNETGADGIFIPCICDEKHIAEVVSNTRLPINVMCLPNLPDMQRLHSLGVKRLSMGPFAFQKAYKQLSELSSSMRSSGSFTGMFA